MKNTIQINGKTYRFRYEELAPLEFYENCNDSARFPHAIRFIDTNGMMQVRSLTHRFTHRHEEESSWDLIEVKPELTDRERLIEHFKKSSTPKAIVDKNKFIIKVIDAVDGYFICSQFGKTRWGMLERLATKEDCLSLLLESEEE